ncbi:MAG TPA: ATP-binding cassette domain-containing protein [Terriglobales bacterium]|nr:ATP-binding cassette domain-containing protein [Terriglobales bacterium]
MIELRQVSQLYPARAAANKHGGEKPVPMLRALDQVSLRVEAGEWLAVIGPSGSGKSTLVNLIGCLHRPTSGEIWLDGQNLSTVSSAERNRIRAEKIGFIFQSFHLIPYLTALENVMLAQYFHSLTDEAEALEALERVGLKDRAQHLPAHLSGGEQQRVCIARALINDPKIVLADEPTGNLDARNEELVLRLLRELHRQGRTIIMVTHDPLVSRLADRRVELHHGRIVTQEAFEMGDEEQFDEILEEMWVWEEAGAVAEVGLMEVHGTLSLSMAVEKMTELGLVTTRQHPGHKHDYPPVVNPCHDTLRPADNLPVDGDLVIEFTDRGRKRAEDVIRRHRLAERLFIESLGMQNQEEIAEQACKFEHILSPEATEKICSFLGHPETCPHGATIPPGPCCSGRRMAGAKGTVTQSHKQR